MLFLACRRDCALQFLEARGQFGKARIPYVSFLELADFARRRAPNGLPGADGFAGGDAGLGAGDGPVFQNAVISDADLSAHHHMMPQSAGTGNARLRGDYRVRADLHVMADVHEVIELDAFREARVVQRAAIDGGVRADLHVVRDLHDAHLRKLPVTAAVVGVTKTVRADHRAGVNLDAISDARSAVERDARMNSAVFADPAPGTDYAVRTDLRAVADVGVLSDDSVGPDTDVFADAR